jgi:hypothetical protein
MWYHALASPWLEVGGGLALPGRRQGCRANFLTPRRSMRPWGRVHWGGLGPRTATETGSMSLSQVLRREVEAMFANSLVVFGFQFLGQTVGRRCCSSCTEMDVLLTGATVWGAVSGTQATVIVFANCLNRLR